MRTKSSVAALAIVAFVSLAAWSVRGGEYHHTVSFSEVEVELQNVQGFTRVTMEGCELTEAVGEPQLPARVVRLALPPGVRVLSVEATASDAQELASGVTVFPAQPAYPYSHSQEIPFVVPKPEAYMSAEPYPAVQARFLGQGLLAGMTIAEIAVYPVAFVPAQHRLFLRREIHLCVRFDQGSPAQELDEEGLLLLAKLVDNKEEVDRHRALGLAKRVKAPTEEHEYVIITPPAFRDAFQPLADWKRQKGLAATVVTTEEIYGTYVAKDNAVRIREFLKAMRSVWNIRWVLLGGDVDHVPYRTAYAMDCLQGAKANAIPCDLYFSDLDRTWDENRSLVYGEVADSVDLYPDVFVGRAPVNNVAQVQAFVEKVLTYERNPPCDYQTRALFAADVLWDNPYTDSGVGKDLIDELYVPARFEITKLYHSRGNESVQSVVSALNRGMNLVNHDGHAFTTVMGVGTGYLQMADMDRLANGPRFSVLYSIGCYPANFEEDCIAEHFVRNARGGGVAFIGNSRYGWGSPGNPKYGYSDRFDQQFFRFLFQEGLTRVGQAIGMAKAYYAPFSRQENVYRWCQYEITLLGDPEMPIWTDVPRELTVDCPATVPTGEQEFAVRVLDGGQPVKGASVCVMAGAGVYERGSTDAAGLFVAPVAPGSTLDSLTVTVTAQNYLPRVVTVPVQGEGPYVLYKGYRLEGTSVPDGAFEPGAEVRLEVELVNRGTAPAMGVECVLRPQGQLGTLLDSTASFGDLPPGASSYPVPPGSGFLLRVSEQCSHGDVAGFSLIATDRDGQTWRSAFRVPVAAPLLTLASATPSDRRLGDGDGVLEPGEVVDLEVTVVNRGSRQARGVVLECEAGGEALEVVTPRRKLGTVGIGDTVSVPVEMRVAFGTASPCFPTVAFRLLTEAGQVFTASATIIVGATGFHDDVEVPLAGYVHGGARDLWHVSSRRQHSGLHAWYCGQEDSARYLPNMYTALITPEFRVPPAATLSFWAWYDVAVYSEPGYRGDGLYVQVRDKGQWVLLDFIGTGGALDSALMGIDWLPYVYDISFLDPGTLTAIRFLFESDPAIEYEGVYLDDIVVAPGHLIAPVPGKSGAACAAQFDIQGNYPNPFNPQTEITCIVGQRARVVVGIYDLSGRLVRRLLDDELPPGTHKLWWHGDDRNGNALPSGVYFCVMITPTGRIVRKMTLLR
ncbi:MAG: C25 family cysteine peptidase [bacterium]|nr:C25 family cysteine peptidase [candidate division KSB1 bacterium]MDH7558826.1 C25 family cysteine peptidase [bacterium]